MTRQDTHIFGRPPGLALVAAYKALWGTAEIFVGLLLLFSTAIIRGELAEDPQDLFMNWLLHGLHFNSATSVQIGAVILLLGAVKILVAVGLWFISWKLRRLLIAFLLVITSFAAGELAARFSLLRLGTLAADAFVLVYLWKFLPRHLQEDRPN